MVNGLDCYYLFIMKSATKILLAKTPREIWHRGESYADKGVVNINQDNDQEIRAVVSGTEDYQVVIESTANRVNLSCDCPYFTKNRDICKHIVATAIIWDEKRGISRPNQDLVEKGTVPPPAFSGRDIAKLFEKPLEADLDKLRILPEVTALGGHVRSHSHLPKVPRVALDESQPLSQKEMQRCYSEIKRWSQRKAYDPYFCSGEMVAAFCEMLRIVKRRLSVTPALVAAEILLRAQEFHHTLITALIDDSQGLHRFSEAHLEDIYYYLRNLSVPSRDREQFEQLLQQFEGHRGIY